MKCSCGRPSPTFSRMPSKDARRRRWNDRRDPDRPGRRS
jgi:hypothetical protein